MSFRERILVLLLNIKKILNYSAKVNIINKIVYTLAHNVSKNHPNYEIFIKMS